MKKNHLAYRNSWVRADFQHKHKQNPSLHNFEGFIRQCCVMQHCDHCKAGLQVCFLTNFNVIHLFLLQKGWDTLYWVWQQPSQNRGDTCFCAFHPLKRDRFFLRLFRHYFLGEGINILVAAKTPFFWSCKH